MTSTLLLDNPPSISAAELHEILLTAHASGNVARRRFMDALRALHESRLYMELGFPDIAAYADCTFHYGASQTYDFLRVSKALVDLPEISGAFECGGLSFSLVSELTRVADRESEREWLEFLEGKSVRVVRVELKDALKKGRKHPRRGSYGLPGLPVKLSLEFSPEEHAVVESSRTDLPATRCVEKCCEATENRRGSARPSRSCSIAARTAGARRSKPAMAGSRCPPR